MRNLAYDCLVPLQVSGCGRPLFCLHAVGGTVASYAPLARRLGHLRDVYGLQSRALGGDSMADGSIEEMAARYVAAIASVQTEGPYEFIGYCMGGLIALEMTRTLRAAGDEVALAGVLDTEPPQAVPEALTFAEALTVFSKTIDFSMPFTAGPGVPREQFLRAFRDQAVVQGKLPSAVRVTDVASLVDIYLTNGKAIARYVPKPVPGDVKILLTARPGFSQEELAEGWRDYVDGELHAETVDADHFALMHERNAGQVCAVLNRWLAGRSK